jgi:Zn-dependent protease with chaperone function
MSTEEDGEVGKDQGSAPNAGEANKDTKSKQDEGEVSTDSKVVADDNGSQTAVQPAAESHEVTVFKGLKAKDFQHPQDKRNTQVLSTLVPIEFALRALLLPTLEEAGFLENIGRGVKVSAKQAPTINSLVAEASAQLDIPVPDVFIRQDPRPNAYTLAIQGKRPFIVLTSSLVDLMTLPEIKAVIGHELGHLKCEHSLWITVLNILGLGFDIIELLIPLNLRNLVQQQLTQWRRSAELSCDRAAMLVAQDELVVMSTLMKLTGGSLKLANEFSPEAFALQAEEYKEASNSSLVGMFIRRQDQNQLYPLPILRAREIQSYANSSEYKELKERVATTVKSEDLQLQTA